MVLVISYWVNLLFSYQYSTRLHVKVVFTHKRTQFYQLCLKQTEDIVTGARQVSQVQVRTPTLCFSLAHCNHISSHLSYRFIIFNEQIYLNVSPKTHLHVFLK